MKPINNKYVFKAYLRFSLCLFFTVSFAVFIFWLFLKTSETEIEQIQHKANAYEKEFTQTVDLVYGFDSIYYYYKLINKPQIDNSLLNNVISTQKVIFKRRLAQMNSKDNVLFNKLVNDLNIFLEVKDSIRSLSEKEEMIRNELIQCLNDNREAVRKASIQEFKPIN
jgi:hypothetical protein